MGVVTEGTRVPVVAPSRGWLGQGCCSLSSALKQILLRLSEGRAPPQTSSLPSTALLSCAQKMTCLSLSLSFLSSSGFLSPVLLSPVPTSPPARGGQTQTQLEHARIGELEQNLLLEKAQAERLLRELADNRVTAAAAAASALARRRPCQLPCFIIFSLSLAALLPVLLGFCFSLLHPF